MQRKIRRLSWQTVNNGMVNLLSRMRVMKLVPPDHVIVGVPRGGLPLAVWLSHRTGLPFSPLNPLNGLPEWGKRFIIVDDIVDSTHTAEKLRELNPDAKIVALITPAGVKHEKKFVNVMGGIEHARDTWFVFPWEDPKKARRDLAIYNRDEKRRQRELQKAREMSPEELREFRRRRSAKAAHLANGPRRAPR